MKSKPITLGLLGYPLEHSLSPTIHQAALKAIGVNGEYKLFPVPPESGFRKTATSIINDLRNKEILGLNVTIPYKQHILDFCNRTTKEVKAIGAANTLYTQNEIVVAENTDILGFWRDIKPLIEKRGYTSGTALILGAGGAARAVSYALLTHNWKVIIAARNISKAQKLAQSFKPFNNQLTIVPYKRQTITANLQQANLLINATPVGMHPHNDRSPIQLDERFPEDLIVYDLIYNPTQTNLLKHAIHSGCTCRNGLGMLIEQAALSLERWLGISVPREAMWNAVKEFME